MAAEIAIMALTKTLMTICIVPKTRACLKMLPFAGMINCGGGDRYMAAIFVFSR